MEKKGKMEEKVWIESGEKFFLTKACKDGGI